MKNILHFVEYLDWMILNGLIKSHVFQITNSAIFLYKNYVKLKKKLSEFQIEMIATAFFFK